MESRTYKVAKNIASDVCKTTLKELECTIFGEDFNNGMISAKKNGNLLAYGHNLTLNILKKDNNQVKIEVESTSSGVQIIDWGTNKENEKKLVDLISKKLL
jgi:hypothetical protein